MSVPPATTPTQPVEPPTTDRSTSLALSDDLGDGDATNTTDTAKRELAAPPGPFVSPYEAERIPPPVSRSSTMLQLLQTRPLQPDGPSLRPGYNQSFERRTYIEAALIQVRYPAAATPCAKCQRGSGRYTTCVPAPVNIVSVQGACASCHYQGHGIDCSFRRVFQPSSISLYYRKVSADSCAHSR